MAYKRSNLWLSAEVWPSLEMGAAQPWGAECCCISCCWWWHCGHQGTRACIFGLAFVSSTADLQLFLGARVPAPLPPRVSTPIRLAFCHPGITACGGILPWQGCWFSSCFALLEHCRANRSELKNKDVRINWCQMLRFDQKVTVGLWPYPLLCAVRGRGEETISDICHPHSSPFGHLFKQCALVVLFVVWTISEIICSLV